MTYTGTARPDDKQERASCTENEGDTGVKETQETIAETARSVQPPRTPSRASRSSSMVTPTKISTRNALKTATTPNSSKQSTPSKLQYAEKSYETLPISESISEEHVVQQEGISKLSPEKLEEKQEDNASNIIQNKIYSPLSVKSQEEEAKHVNILEDNKYEANVLQVPVTESSEKASIIACVDRFSIPREEHETKQSSIDEVYKVQKQSVGTKSLEEKIEIKEDINVDKVQDTSEKDIENKISVEQEDVSYRDDTYNDKNTLNIPKIEQSHVIPDEVDKTNNIELKDKEKTTNDNYTTQDEAKDVSINIEDEDEKTDNIPQDEQIIEMSEKKQEDASKLNAEKSNQKEYNDRKRKRSHSPIEVHQASPVLQKGEGEPDFDESAMILSWYDSDLNLVIDKEGFLSATPMHNSDFRHIWAGARASHGFINGKVYYEAKITEHHSSVTKDEKYVLRIGWSVPFTSMQLGEKGLSYAYTSAGQKGTEGKFTDYGSRFGKDDVVGCYLDMTPENTVELSYTVNGKDLGSAFSISKEKLGNRPLFPHILSKNCTFVCNFGQEHGWCEQIPDYILVGNVESKDRIAGPRRPDAKTHCEVIMICGLPGAGKTTWARKYTADHPDKLYNILALHNLVEKTGDVALSDQEKNCRRDVIIDKCNRALDQLIDVASGRRRNYILDQKSNVYSSVQRRKIRNFCEYQRKAVVVIPTDEEYNQRLSAHNAIERDVSESDLKEMKANFTAPLVGENFDAVEWVGLDEKEGKKLIEKYNKEGKEAGFGQQSSTAKRPHLDKIETSNRETRDSRNNRDTRDHRRNNYQDRGRNTPWRGPNMGGWRGERPQRGGYMRHSGGYGPPHTSWRLRGRGGHAMIRGVDRRVGNVDRRSGNDRNRSVVPRQGGWGPVSGSYQGTQQSGWGQQDNWSSNQTQGNWNQQSTWGQQQWAGGWKGYGQSTYSQAGYNQQGYGNGNWNSWNQQYYNNQYWGQQQQGGQTTAAGSQAEITSEMIASTSTNIGAGYSYSQQ
ncbi:heterogeneous nuclear ribonucleoprotein U isoform X2 [Polyergus mexicanus]|uniref:heterogeneous nuclear ribonucleoprotein U isoform X2 n=1 Tax=Polyergus mexicanus TaxID=615972 RepID=UPI0038B54581